MQCGIPAMVQSAETLKVESQQRRVSSTKGVFVWDQSGIRIIGIMQVSICLGAILIPEYLDFHSGYSTPRSRIAGIYSGIYYGISQTNPAKVTCKSLLV